MVETYTLTLACLQAGPGEAKSRKVKFVADAVRMLNGARLTLSGLYDCQCGLVDSRRH